MLDFNCRYKDSIPTDTEREEKIDSGTANYSLTSAMIMETTIL